MIKKKKIFPFVHIIVVETIMLFPRIFFKIKNPLEQHLIYFDKYNVSKRDTSIHFLTPHF